MPVPPVSPSPSPGQPPVGSSPATSPVPNKGLEAAGLAKLGLVVRQLEQLVPLLGVGTEAGKDVIKALTSLSKHVQPGAVSPGAEQTGLQNMLMKLRQQGPQLAQMRQQMSGGGKPGGEGGGAGAPPPMPQAA